VEPELEGVALDVLELSAEELESEPLDTAVGAEAVVRVWCWAVDCELLEPDDVLAFAEVLVAVAPVLVGVARAVVTVVTAADAFEDELAWLAFAASAMTAPAPSTDPAATPTLTRCRRRSAASRLAGVRSMTPTL
jgi:hypothetical protein